MRPSFRKVLPRQSVEAQPVAHQAPKRNIAKEIRRRKRRFDYLVIPTEDGMCFVVDGTVKAENAARLYLNHYPQADAGACYSRGRCRFNVRSRSYELVGEDAPRQGTFPVHVFRMEARRWRGSTPGACTTGPTVCWGSSRPTPGTSMTPRQRCPGGTRPSGATL